MAQTPIHSYPFRDSLENTIDPSKPATGYTINHMADRHSLNKAFKFNSGVYTDIEIPPETIHGLNDVTFTIWHYRSNENPSTTNPCLFSAKRAAA